MGWLENHITSHTTCLPCQQFSHWVGKLADKSKGIHPSYSINIFFNYISGQNWIEIVVGVELSIFLGWYLSILSTYHQIQDFIPKSNIICLYCCRNVKTFFVIQKCQESSKLSASLQFLNLPYFMDSVEYRICYMKL